jgi:hypothetical protein
MGPRSLDVLAERAESGKGGSDAEVCRRDAHEPRVPVAYCHRNGFTSTAPRLGRIAYSAKEILEDGCEEWRVCVSCGR